MVREKKEKERIKTDFSPFLLLTKRGKYPIIICVPDLEGYRSGHNEAVLKTVWEKSHKGSNPFPSAKEKDHNEWSFSCHYKKQYGFGEVPKQVEGDGLLNR